MRHACLPLPLTSSIDPCWLADAKSVERQLLVPSSASEEVAERKRLSLMREKEPPALMEACGNAIILRSTGPSQEEA